MLRTTFTADPSRTGATVYRHDWDHIGTGWYCRKCGQQDYGTVAPQMGCPVSDLAAAKGE